VKRSVLVLMGWLLFQSLGVTEATAQTIDSLEDSVDVDVLDVLIDDGANSETTVEEPRPYDPLRSPSVCPTDPEDLTDLMIRDLPNYTNRVLQRTVAVLPWTEEDEQKERDGEFVRRPYRPSYVLVAGQVSLAPLDLDDYTYTTESAAGGPLTQVFFTTMSRQYAGLRVNEVQEYHWLFLAETTDGWWPAFMFSSIDNVESPRAALPPYESSQSSVGQAVQLWLRDCRAGAIASTPSR